MADIWRNTDLQDLEGEVWKDVVGYEGLYMVSSLGRIKSVERQVWNKHNQCYNTIKEKIRKQTLDSKGYPHLVLSSNGMHKTAKVHFLVCQTFIVNPDSKPNIDHINTIRTDNRVENLRWCTQKENQNNPLTRKHLSECQKGEKSPGWGKTGKEHVCSVPIVQLTLKGEFIRCWDALADVYRELGIRQSNICHNLKGKRHTAGGYKWMYFSEYNKGV